MNQIYFHKLIVRLISVDLSSCSEICCICKLQMSSYEQKNEKCLLPTSLGLKHKKVSIKTQHLHSFKAPSSIDVMPSMKQSRLLSYICISHD